MGRGGNSGPRAAADGRLVYEGDPAWKTGMPVLSASLASRDASTYQPPPAPRPRPPLPPLDVVACEPPPLDIPDPPPLSIPDSLRDYPRRGKRK
jgi:hypothetical protein